MSLLLWGDWCRRSLESVSGRETESNALTGDGAGDAGRAPRGAEREPCRRHTAPAQPEGRAGHTAADGLGAVGGGVGHDARGHEPHALLADDVGSATQRVEG